MVLSRFLYELIGLRIFPTKRTPSTLINSLIKELSPTAIKQELIRLGSLGDGGYLLPEDFENIEACFSPGVAKDSSFEHQLAEKGIKIFLADYSVDSPPSEHRNFSFCKKYIGSYSDDHFITLDDWVSSSISSKDSDLILQMDIEGSEYETILSVSEQTLSRFSMILIEFHGLHNLWSYPFFKLASSCFKKLLREHSCVHIHPNNTRGVVSIEGIEIPKLMEFTFYRRDKVEKVDEKLTFPHPLDSDNTNKPSIALPKCWASNC